MGNLADNELLVRELEQWYRTMPSDISYIVNEWNEAQHRGALARVSGLYALAADRLDIKVFRHFPLFFELNAGKSRAQRPSEGLAAALLPNCEPDEEYAALDETLRKSDLAQLPQRLDIPSLPDGGENVLRLGTDGLRAALNESAGRAQAQRRRDFCAQALQALDAAERLAARFSETAGHMAAVEVDPKVRASLQRMAGFDIKTPARDAYSALQALLFWHELCASLCCARIPAWGCLDAALADIDLAGDDAAVLLKCFLTYHGLRCRDDRRSLTLGWSVNPATYAILDALDDEALEYNDVYLYVGEDDPEEYRRRALALMKRGATLINRALCDEPRVVSDGLLQPAADIAARVAFMDLPAVLIGTEWPTTVDNWKCLHIDAYCGGFFSADDLFSATLDNICALSGEINGAVRRALKKQPAPAPALMISAARLDCIERARDITETTQTAGCAALGFDGAGAFVRAFSTLKRLVYDQCRVPSERLLKALENDFEDDGPLQRICSELSPDVDQAVVERLQINLRAMFSSGDTALVMKPNLGALPRMGARLIATPDGRRRGEGLESDLLPERTDCGPGTVCCQWAPANEVSAQSQLSAFCRSGALVLLLYS